MSDDLNWLAAQRPSELGGSRDAHDRALLALRSHANARPARRRPALRLPGLLSSRTLAVSAGAGAAAIAAAAVLSVGGRAKLPLTTGHGSSSALHAVVSANGTRSLLIRLADDLSTTTAGSGDATLIQRTTHTGGQNWTGYDLYGDNGTYYYSQAESGMPAQVAGNDNQGGFGRELAAAREAMTGSVAQAAIDMADAMHPGLTPPAGIRYNNVSWVDALEAMIAGASDPQVRAGVLKILATLPGMSVTQGSAGGVPTLVLTAGSQETGHNYSEQLTVNAETGMPIQFVGGTPGATPATTVDYQVARVTLSDVAAGTLPSF